MENRKSQPSINDLVGKTNIHDLFGKGVRSSKWRFRMLSVHGSMWADGAGEEGGEVYSLGPIFPEWLLEPDIVIVLGRQKEAGQSLVWDEGQESPKQLRLQPQQDDSPQAFCILTLNNLGL